MAIPALIILLWWHGSKSGWWSPYILPGPGTVLDSLVFLAETGELSRNVTASAARIAKGFSASAAAALAMAFACGVCRPLWRQVSPTVEFLRHIPPMATIPLLILWFGIGELSKLMIIAMATFFPIFLNTAQSVSQCDKRLIEVARAFGYTRAQELRYVVFPASLPYILTGMRLGLGYSWRSLIAAELVAASSGLGYMILGAEQLSRPDVILAGVLVIGLLGSSIDMSLSYLAARLVPYGNASDGVV
ncbi:MAG: ABC transporter permease [Synergistaceae bacterium]|nr:ABC transporter permease [Synergistaceae bacterium]